MNYLKIYEQKVAMKKDILKLIISFNSVKINFYGTKRRDILYRKAGCNSSLVS